MERRSRAFPFLAPDVLSEHLDLVRQLDDTTWIRGFRRWVRDTLGPSAKGVETAR